MRKESGQAPLKKNATFVVVGKQQIQAIKGNRILLEIDNVLYMAKCFIIYGTLYVSP